LGNKIPKVDAQETADLLARLVSIDSQNPDLVPGAAGESAIAHAIAGIAAAGGMEVELIEPAPGRTSVLARLRGSGGGRTLLLNGHVDTVALGEMENALSPSVRDGRMYGRGVYDMKAGVTAMLVAALTLSKAPPAGDLLIMAVADEEFASTGTQSVLDHMRRRGIKADGAIVTEPTELEVCVAHKGFAWAEISTRGKAAHGSRRAEGVDAIFHMGRVLRRLEELDNDLQERPPHPLLGHGSLHASLISGGSGLSTYPDNCVLQVERRTLPGEDESSVGAELEELLQSERDIDPSFAANCRVTLYRAPFEVTEDEAIVRSLRAAAASVLGAGIAARSQGATYWMDSALIAGAGIPTVVFGPRGEGAHSKVEWVELASVAQCAQVLVQTAYNFC
jgi:acetylornithine deacetylase/succinyl-diaminopimelate desuccinylase family protein